MKYLFYYIIFINFAAFILMASDKRRAKKNRGRIPEAALMFFALIGGCLGALLGMLAFRHKTRHPKFYIGLPLITAAYAAIAVLLLIKKP